MKTLIILALLPVLCQAFVKHDIVLRRAKRQVATFSDLHALQCVDRCTSMFGRTLDGMKESNSPFFLNEELLNKKRLDKICLLYNEVDTCTSQCNVESSAIAQTVVKALKPFDLICKTHYEDFVSYLPCYSASVNAINQQCSTTCGDPESFSADLERKMTAQLISRNQDDLISAFNNIMEETCDVTSCHLRCQSRVIAERCAGEIDEGAADFMRVLTKQIVESVSQVLKAITPQLSIPEDCVSREEPSPDINRTKVIKNAIKSY